MGGRVVVALVPVAVVVAIGTSCRPAPPGAVPSGTTVSNAAHVPREPSGLRATMTGPARVGYASTVLGLNRSEMLIDVTNVTARPLSLGDMRVRFSAERDGVAFACGPALRTERAPREPSVLGPGETFRFGRALGCWTPLAGRWTIGAEVRFGQGPGAPLQPASVAMEIDAAGDEAPRAYPGRPGMHVAMDGDALTPPIPYDAAKRGEYHVVIALINASRAPVPAGGVTVAFRVFKKPSPLPCAGESLHRSVPAALGAGEVYMLRAAVTCLREEQGDYDVVGLLAFDDAPIAEGFEVGRVHVRITADPMLLWPLASR